MTLRATFTVLALTATLMASSCSSRYAIRPDRDDPIEIDGHSAQVVDSDACVVSAFSLENEYDDLFIEFRVKNKVKGNLEIVPTQFTLSGPAMKGETLRAVNPDEYFSKLKGDADNLESRTKLNTYEGVDVLTREMPGADKDADLKKARRDYEDSESQKKDDLKSAVDLRVKEKVFRPLLTKGVVASQGSEAQGKILFAGPFPQEGKITLNFLHPKCEAHLPFVLTK